MSKVILVQEIVGSQAADDDSKGDKVFEEIQKVSQDGELDIILDFRNIELVNTAFLNNAIGQLFNKEVYNISRNKVRIANMQPAMIELLKESISIANEKYA